MAARPFAPVRPFLRLAETLRALIAVVARLLPSRPETPAAPAPAPGGGAEDGFAALGRLLATAHNAGIEAERERIGAIMDSPRAASNLAFAWRLASSGELTLQQVEQAFAAAATDATIPTDETAPTGALLN